MVRLFIVSIIGLVFSVQALQAQDSYSDRFLAVKKRFSDIEVKALAEEFHGIQTSSGKQEGLFPLRATGVSTKPIVDAVKAYLALLSTPELIRTQFAVDDPEWRRWFNVDNGIYVRQGISLKEMSAIQRSAAKKILEASLSAKGLKLSYDIMKTDKTLSELNSSEFLDEELYFITVMGNPSETEPWGWQLDGHHLVINYFVQGDQVVMTPTFLGAEPSVAKAGKYKGNRVLQDEQDVALAFMKSLSLVQQQNALLDNRKPKNNMLAAAHSDNLVLDYAGLRASALSKSQKGRLLNLIINGPLGLRCCTIPKRQRGIISTLLFARPMAMITAKT